MHMDVCLINVYGSSTFIYTELKIVSMVWFYSLWHVIIMIIYFKI